MTVPTYKFKAYNLTKNKVETWEVDRSIVADDILPTARSYSPAEAFFEGPLKMAFSEYKIIFIFHSDKYLMTEETLKELQAAVCLTSLGD